MPLPDTAQNDGLWPDGELADRLVHDRHRNSEPAFTLAIIRSDVRTQVPTIYALCHQAPAREPRRSAKCLSWAACSSDACKMRECAEDRITRTGRRLRDQLRVHARGEVEHLRVGPTCCGGTARSDPACRRRLPPCSGPRAVLSSYGSRPKRHTSHFEAGHIHKEPSHSFRDPHHTIGSAHQRPGQSRCGCQASASRRCGAPGSRCELRVADEVAKNPM
jgi:hypothetical protein